MLFMENNIFNKYIIDKRGNRVQIQMNYDCKYHCYAVYICVHFPNQKSTFGYGKHYRTCTYKEAYNVYCDLIYKYVNGRERTKKRKPINYPDGIKKERVE